MFRERAFLRRWREARRSQKSEDCCVVLTPSISPAQPKKVLGPARPQSRLQMWPRLLCVPAPCQSSGWNQTGLALLSLGLRSDRLRGPNRARGGKKKKKLSNATRVQLFLNRELRGPSLCHFTSHNTTFTQPNSFCGVGPSQNTSASSPYVFSWHGQTQTGRA